MQYEIKELLKFVTGRGLISLVNINSRIQLFPFSSCDVKTKPGPITLSSADHSLRQSGEYMLLSITLLLCTL